MSVTIRPGTAEDAAACGTICYEAFKTVAEQHNFPPDFPEPAVAIGFLGYLLQHPRIHSVVAEAFGRVVGSNFLWEHDAIAGVGPITVDPSAQNGAVGRMLMNSVLDRAAHKRFAGVRLVQAAYHNRSLSLYAKLGFDVREPLSCIQGPPIKADTPGYRVRPATPEDLDACDAVCRAIHGHDRHNELAEAIQQGSARVVERAGRIRGYSTVIAFFGHAVAESNGDLEALIAAADEFGGPGFLLPSRNAGLVRWCLEHGLRVVQPMTLMATGLYNTPRGAFLPSILF